MSVVETVVEGISVVEIVAEIVVEGITRSMERISIVNGSKSLHEEPVSSPAVVVVVVVVVDKTPAAVVAL